MGIFDGGKADQIKYLEEERKKLWEKILFIESQFSKFKAEVEKKTPEVEKEAREHSRKASEYRNKIEKRLEESEELYLKINSELNSAIVKKDEIVTKGSEVKQITDSIEESIRLIDEAENMLNQKIENINIKIAKIDTVFENYPDLDEEITRIEELVAGVEENKEKSDLTLNEVNKKKKEIDSIHRNIFGYSQKDEYGSEVIEIEGLKVELEKAYNLLNENLEIVEVRVQKIKEEYESKFVAYEKSHNDKHASIIEEIKNLLPNALTAGLSSAFSKKKEDELKSSSGLQNKFNIGIGLLIFISLFPLFISIYFLNNGTELLEVINRIPRLVLAIIPMYIPALWFTISASKKLNLSKRLVEEYSHKEVLSRTYEGLSNQIANIQDPEQSEELKFRLLTNFLQVTSENPGKLISNYNTSDHPVMEALEQSYKFQLAIDKLDSIPGLGKISEFLGRKAKRLLDEKARKIEEGILKDNLE